MMKVTSTIPLNETQKKLIITRLNKLTNAKKILLKKVVDSRIYGGLVLETSNNVVNINIKDRSSCGFRKCLKKSKINIY